MKALKNIKSKNIMKKRYLYNDFIDYIIKIN